MSATTRVLLATCAALPRSDEDNAGLPEALGEVGLRGQWAVWDDKSVDFAAADLVVLRTTWDYVQRRDEFLDWCESVPTLLNPARIVRWNTHKGYLADLAAAGVSVVPTRVAEPGERLDWPDGEFVVKPAVGAGSRDAARFTGEEHDLAEKHLHELHADGRDAMVQPYQRAVDRAGETALVFLGGVYSHSFVKGPMLRSSTRADEERLDSSGLFMAEGLQAADPEPALRRAAEDVLDAAAGIFRMSRADLLYARVDLVRDDHGKPLLLELELSEPSLGFRYADAGARWRFASAVRAALSS